jgi:7,8-dihydropterin-6-yl-methyl-4-(beta-D-ribofuranosyl)aminobenzene 5'-phosphate synthase
MTAINELDQVEILTLQDNYIDMTARDNSEMIYRGGTKLPGKPRKSILSEHGFSAIVRTMARDRARTMLFDFGYSEIGAPYNAGALDVDMGQVEAIALSHGHSDHMGGFRALVQMIGKPGIEFVVHPGAFRPNRYTKIDGGKSKSPNPPFTKAMTEEAQVSVVAAKEPRPMLGGDVLFLGEVPRRTAFETGMPNAFYEEGGVEKEDPIADDTSLVMHLRGKGLIVLSGCAHAGIINTVARAREATGIERIHAIMGGFHINYSPTDPVVVKTLEELKKIAPRYIVPTHCTGRKSIQLIEEAMPDAFVLNMSGTRLTFMA